MSKKTIRNLIISLVLAALSAGLFGLMVYYVSDQGGKLATQIEALEAEHAQQESYIKSQRLAQDTKKERDQLHSYFLDEASDSINFLNEIEMLAPKVGVSLETKGLDSFIDEKENTEWIKVDFKFSGSRKAVKQFVEILEILPYASRVNEVELSSQSSNDWSATVKMQVRILAYDK